MRVRYLLRSPLVALALLTMPWAALAQTTTLSAPALVWSVPNGATTSPPVSIIGYDSGTGLPCIVGKTNTCLLAVNANITVGASAPYILTSTGFQQVGSFSTATGFTPPATSTVCFIQAEGNSVRFRTDGTNPTASVGQLLPVGALMTETANLSGTKFIPTTGSATLDVDCYK